MTEDLTQPVEEVAEVIEESQIEDNQETEVTESTETEGEPPAPSAEIDETDKEEARLGFQSRQRKQNAIKQRNDELQRENELLSKRLNQQYEPAPVQPERQQYRDQNAKPMLSDYDDPDQWADDRDAWSARQMEGAQRNNSIISTYAENCEKYAQDNPKFVEDIQASPILPSMNAFISNVVKKSPDGARITHMLANDDRLASQINNMAPEDAVRKVMELEGKSKAVKSVSTSSAPRSPNTQKSTSVATSGKDLYKGSYADYARMRDEQRQNRR